ncbi:histone-binding protein RBBP4 [Nematocida minor]|uniref:histone-binding protein RBBP4 n=1 Tax=Nematocida minor TaxID=1912983 RepID=UPI00221E822F|nr:histone-binding protein RBBP4 [Nematocida minor]XP_051332044.1 histone-binding protein RBBP4 [Nematocida minor]KAI5188774.1 histone-binding protein RBBP4 [Nematocida minor]KAI5188878.1 histone-binding protein RBBP4 [Nematocida minor]
MAIEEMSPEEITICEEFKTWRKNVPYLYDMLLSHALTWPSLTVQWFPDAVRNEETETTTQRLLLSTQTSGQEDEYLQIVSVTLPDTVGDAAVRTLEDGGYGLGESKVRVTQKIPMPYEVNRARYMHSNTNIIAVRYDSPEVHIYDYTKHPSFGKEAVPDVIFEGHTKGGFGLAWNPVEQNELCTAGYDGTVCVYKMGQGTAPVMKIQENEEINDIAISNDGETIALGLDKNGTTLVDMRSGEKKTLKTGETLSVQFSPENSTWLATGSKGGSLSIWDTRNDAKPLYNLVGHESDVTQVEWSPHYEMVLASCSSDRRVRIWDLSKVGEEQAEEDREDGPPELLFIHGGHTDALSDISWNPHEPWEIASVANDNILQIWQISSEIAGDADFEGEEPEQEE